MGARGRRHPRLHAAARRRRRRHAPKPSRSAGLIDERAGAAVEGQRVRAEPGRNAGHPRPTLRGRYACASEQAAQACRPTPPTASWKSWPKPGRSTASTRSFQALINYKNLETGAEEAD
ncbi:MAG: hypothetical protein WKG07_14325 [Hymenobacter sp.]